MYFFLWESPPEFYSPQANSGAKDWTKDSWTPDMQILSFNTSPVISLSTVLISITKLGNDLS